MPSTRAVSVVSNIPHYRAGDAVPAALLTPEAVARVEAPVVRVSTVEMRLLLASGGYVRKDSPLYERFAAA